MSVWVRGSTRTHFRKCWFNLKRCWLGNHKVITVMMFLLVANTQLLSSQPFFISYTVYIIIYIIKSNIHIIKYYIPCLLSLAWVYTQRDISRHADCFVPPLYVEAQKTIQSIRFCLILTLELDLQMKTCSRSLPNSILLHVVHWMRTDSVTLQHMRTRINV